MLAKYGHIKIPYMGLIEWFTGLIKSKYTVAKPAEGTFMAQYQLELLPLSNTKTPPPATEPQPQPEQQEPQPQREQKQTQSNIPSTATSLVLPLGVLHICGYLVFLNLSFNL
jgi:hypothetical protein